MSTKINLKTDKPITLTPLALALIHNSEVRSKIIRDNSEVRSKIIRDNSEVRSRIIREEREREKRMAQAKITAITPHATPLRKVKQFWEQSYGARDFEAQQRAYNGAPRLQESGNLTHDLTCLINCRK